jgi:hypothetical protein
MNDNSRSCRGKQKGKPEEFKEMIGKLHARDHQKERRKARMWYYEESAISGQNRAIALPPRTHGKK